MHSQEGYSALSVIYATGLESHENQSFTEQPGLTVINHGSLKKPKTKKQNKNPQYFFLFPAETVVQLTCFLSSP